MAEEDGMTTQHAMQARSPRIRLWFPDWWHGHGIKVRVHTLDVTARTLVLSSSAAKLTITPHKENPVSSGWDWDVVWEVVHIQPDCKAGGLAAFSNQELAAAFYLSDDPGIGATYSQWLLDRYGGDLAVQGHFIRWEGYTSFLNIPGPGTGHDGDTNLSLGVTPKIKEAVRQLLVNV